MQPEPFPRPKWLLNTQDRVVKQFRSPIWTGQITGAKEPRRSDRNPVRLCAQVRLG